MKFILIGLIVLFSSVALSFEIDVEASKERVAANPQDLEVRLLLVRHFLDNDNHLEARRFLDEALLIDVDADNSLLKSLEKQLEVKEVLLDFGSYDEAVERFYQEQEYNLLILFYENLKKTYPQDNVLQDSSLLKIAQVLSWEGEFSKSLEVLKQVQDKTGLQYHEIKALGCLQLGNISCAKRYYRALYQSIGDVEHGKKLVEIYLHEGDLNQAKRLLDQMKKAHGNKGLLKYDEEIQRLEALRLVAVRDAYEKDASFKNMQALAFAIYENSPEEATNFVLGHVESYPRDIEAKVFLARLYSWQDNNKRALEILSPLSDDMEAQLLKGRVLAWESDFEEAKKVVNKVYSKGNKQQKHEAKKVRAFIYSWEGDIQKSKELFEEILLEHPGDAEVEKQLVFLRVQTVDVATGIDLKNIKALIKKLERDFARSNDIELASQLGRLHLQAGNNKRSAHFYEKYLQAYPEKIELYRILGDIYLEMDQHYKGFGYWEYYAHITNTDLAYFQLAQRYFWEDFNSEALEVLNNLILRSPTYQESFKLKAEILRIQPRFIKTDSQAKKDDNLNKRANKILELADRLYFSNLYAGAVEHYSNYLELNPSNYIVRERYAYALELAGYHARAAGEFYVLQWVNNSPMIKFRHAYNLQMSGDLDRARKVYASLLPVVPRAVPDFINQFLKDWESGWESKDINQYVYFYDNRMRNNISWRLRKESIFNRNKFISVKIMEPSLISKKGDIYTIEFFQIYASSLLSDEGLKTLRLRCGENNSCKIIKETWKAAKYVPGDVKGQLFFIIQQRLAEIDALAKKPEKPVAIVNQAEVSAVTVPEEAHVSMFKDVMFAEGVRQSANYLGYEKVLSKAMVDLVEIDRSNVIPISYIVEPIDYSLLNQWRIKGNIDFFEDNKDTSFQSHGVSLGKRIYKDIFLHGFVQEYNLNDAGQKSNGGYFGLGLDSSRWDARHQWYAKVFLDYSGSKDNIGWGLGYTTPVLNNKVTFSLHRDNLVHSRRNICSSGLMRTKAQVSSTYKITEQRNFWWSLEQESIDDGNRVFTPQFQFDFYDRKFGAIETAFFVSGWYQFNQQQSNCYYSPKKVDNNLLGVEGVYPLTENLNLVSRAAIGYSFWDEVTVYQAGLWLRGDIIDNIPIDLGCAFSKSSRDTSQNYQTNTCGIKISKEL